MKTTPMSCFAAAFAASAAICSVQAADVVKDNNSTLLNDAASWVAVPPAASVSPTETDVAIFNGTLTANRSSGIGANISWAGIKVTDAGGTLHTIAATASSTLTLGASGIDMSAATANLSIAAVMDLSAAQTWNVASGRLLTISGTNTGSGALNLAGSGTFSINNSAAFGTTAVTLANGVILSKALSGVLTLSNALTLNGDVKLVSNNSNGFNLNGGLNLGSSNRTLFLDNGNGTGSYIFAGGLDALTPKLITGAGALILENANTGGAPAQISVTFGAVSGTTKFIQVNSDLVIGSNIRVLLTTNSVLTADTDVTVQAGGFLNMANGGTVVSPTVGSLSGAGTVTKETTGSGTAIMTIDGGVGTGSTTFSGVINNGTGSGTVGMIKAGSTTQVLSGANTYTGSTLVTGGKLLVNGTHIQSVAGAGYTVSTGGTLGGSGRIARFTSAPSAQNAVLVQSGGFLAPGDGGVGTLTLDGVNFSGTTAAIGVLNMATGAQFNFDLAGNGSGADTVAFWNFAAGDLILNSNAVNLALAGTPAAGTYTVSLFRFYSDNGVTASTSSVLTGGLVAGMLGNGISDVSFAYNGSTIDVTYTVSSVPEPSAWAAILGGFALVVVVARRRR